MHVLGVADRIDGTCPRSGKPVQDDPLTGHDGWIVGFRNAGCRDKFEGPVRHVEKAKASAGHGPLRPRVPAAPAAGRGAAQIDGIGRAPQTCRTLSGGQGTNRNGESL